jgi:probable F420-dependent oxidoreductase
VELWLNVNFIAPHDLRDEARLAEELGFSGLVVGEHLLEPPMNDRSTYPYQSGERAWDVRSDWPDPWVLFGALAAVTNTLRFCTSICIAPAHDTVSLAKAVATASYLSDGRVAFGAGLGWLREDFEMAGKEFTRRGKALDRLIPTLRTLWNGDGLKMSVAGREQSVFLSGPLPPRPIPILIGGHSTAALHRAAGADGWLGANVKPEDVAPTAAIIATERRRLGLGDDAQVLVMLEGEPDPASMVRAVQDGATGVVLPATKLNARTSAERQVRLRDFMTRLDKMLSERGLTQ